MHNVNYITISHLLILYIHILDSYIQQLYIYYHRDNLLFFFLPHRSTASLMGNSSTGGPSIAILNNESSDFFAVDFVCSFLLILTERMSFQHQQYVWV